MRKLGELAKGIEMLDAKAIIERMKKRRVEGQEAARLTIEYLTRLPDKIPVDRILVHNDVRPAKRLGTRGFRAWLQVYHIDAELCSCKWAPEMGSHYRSKQNIKGDR